MACSSCNKAFKLNFACGFQMNAYEIYAEMEF